MRQDTSRNASRAGVGGSRSEAEEARLTRRVQGFAASVRPAVERLARQAPQIEDLADSFPALLFALATGFGTEPDRRRALTAVLEGLPLKEAAQRLALPFWLRKLPAGSFAAPLVALPSEPQLVARLVSLVPPTPASAAAWLERVMLAHHAGGPALALWVGQQYRAAQPAARSASFLHVLAWAWFCTSAPGTRAAALLSARWSPTIGYRRAVEDSRLWRERIALDICLGAGLADTWLSDGRIADLEFVALRTADDFIAEARSMDNCLDRYADRLVGRAARVFSIRRDGRSIADIEIAAHENEPGHPVIAQLRGAHNRRAPLEVWQAAYAWLGAQPLRLADRRMQVRLGSAARDKRARAIWQPFIEVLPVHVQEATFALLAGKRRRARSSAVPTS
jgi:hypothetical protein